MLVFLLFVLGDDEHLYEGGYPPRQNLNKQGEDRIRGGADLEVAKDIDRSLSLGASLKGAAWQRPNDTVGLAGAINELSTAHREFFAAGGLGTLIGDGRLNYAPEGIIETYYNCRVVEPVSLSLDYQLVGNPAYNQDRGPVHVFALRLHVEF